ncbi:hypothetical protein [Acidiphilium acidophilum]|uniref:DUF433 domain-containing protein n=1 Tax=Acidiphilium acidophilum TaxID=76588 RepID=A0AAW9DVY2_ACIAO|nr:hypothetical protein [Acidiphilium acidophilum]MDX5932452.1 hypothetical protein [Acidiphilium acidophilum]
MSKKDELVEIYTRVEITARDVASILGWGYDPKILGVVLSTRSNILSIIRYMALTKDDLAAKRKVVENYFDIEGSIGAWVSEFAKKLGIPTTGEE